MQEEFLRLAVVANPEDRNSVDITTIETEVSPSIIGLLHLRRMHVVNEQYGERAGTAIQQSVQMVCYLTLLYHRY